MSDCPWRYLTADGRTVRCSGQYGDAHDDDHALFGLMVEHGWDDFPHIVGWEEDDPCAWDATCPDCGGPAYPKPRLTEADQRGLCRTCGGAGTVDTIPAALIGVGSVVMWHGDAWLVAKRWPDSLLLVRSVGTNQWVEQTATYIDHADLVRAVPPAGDTT